ncbi:MAG: hypothetical protein JJ922_15820 [Parvibaculum sp.]|nr:hypothetical protein [Parvibaculum sp.]MBO6693470.1 hypothetical protein [Parvibaculum sp.]MBO6713387.1 hypothetical protein [Parvibaculum sp.]
MLFCSRVVSPTDLPEAAAHSLPAEAAGKTFHDPRPSLHWRPGHSSTRAKIASWPSGYRRSNAYRIKRADKTRFVTIGLMEGNYQGPTIRRGVSIGTGAKVLGPVTLGRGCMVGANAVVIKNVPSNTTVVGVPARPIKKKVRG